MSSLRSGLHKQDTLPILNQCLDVLSLVCRAAGGCLDQLCEQLWLYFPIVISHNDIMYEASKVSC